MAYLGSFPVVDLMRAVNDSQMNDRLVYARALDTAGSDLVFWC